jgi:hypothetical protein
MDMAAGEENASDEFFPLGHPSPVMISHAADKPACALQRRHEPVA